MGYAREVEAKESDKTSIFIVLYLSVAGGSSKMCQIRPATC